MEMSEQSIKLFKSNLNRFLQNHKRVRDTSVRRHILEIGTLQIKGINEYQRINGLFQQRMMDIGLNIENSLLLSRLWEYLFRHFHWLIFTVISGMYKEAIMEMRFILESWVQAYYIDLNYLELSLNEKIELLKEKEVINEGKTKLKKLNWYGVQLFNRTFVDEAFHEKIYAFYRNLCNFSHGSYIELSKYQKIMNVQQKLMFVDPEYDFDMYRICLTYFQEMHGFLMKFVENIFVRQL